MKKTNKNKNSMLCKNGLWHAATFTEHSMNNEITYEATFNHDIAVSI